MDRYKWRTELTPVFEYFTIENYLDRYKEQISYRCSSLDKAEELLKLCHDNGLPAGTGRIYRIRLFDLDGIISEEKFLLKYAR